MTFQPATEYTDFAEGHLWPKGRMIWIEGDLDSEIYEKLYTQDMMGPLERYGKLPLRRNPATPPPS